MSNIKTESPPKDWCDEKDDDYDDKDLCIYEIKRNSNHENKDELIYEIEPDDTIIYNN